MKEQFLWGSATAAYQCEGAWNEGGRGLTQWDVFSHESDRNLNHVTGDTASDFYHHYEEDIRMLHESNQNSYRFSIAWTRIFPNGYGEINQEGVNFYNRIIDLCLQYHIEPNVTLHHYDLPIELAENGGWLNDKTIDYFVDYARTCFELFGDRVKLWVTINELSFYAHCCFLVGNYPPHHELDFTSYSKVIYNGLLASAKAVTAYRKLKQGGKIGIVHPCGSVESLHDDSDYAQARYNAELYCIRCILDPAVKGEIPQELIVKMKDSGLDTSFIREEDKKILKEGIVDFIGLNFYLRELVKPCMDGVTKMSMNNKGKGSDVMEGTSIHGWFASDNDPWTEKNHWGREVHPKSLYDALTYLDRLYPQVPIYVTENGHALFDELEKGEIHDIERIRIVQGFLDWMLQAKKQGVNVKGYYMWSTMDLYSWVNGYKKRYGLVYIDFDDNCKRIAKDSFYWYKRYIEDYQRRETAVI